MVSQPTLSAVLAAHTATAHTQINRRVRVKFNCAAWCITLSTAWSRFATIKRDRNEAEECELARRAVDELVHLVGGDHQNVACTALVKCAVVLDACRAAREDDFMFIVVLMSRGHSTGGNGVVTHREGWGAVRASHHEAHRDSARTRHRDRDRIDLFETSLEHGRQSSGYVLTVAKLRIKGFPLGAWQTNCWLVWIDDDAARPGWIIDTGDHPAPLLDAIRTHGITVGAILFTHAHLDHIMGLEEIIAAVGEIPRYAHTAEHAWFGDPQLNLSAFADVAPVSVRAPTHALNDGDTPTLGATQWRVVHTPGHSPGSVSFICDAAKVVIAGDTLFAGSIGRSDFASGDGALLLESIRTKLLALPDAFVVHPGHGPSTTIGRERISNPWLQQ